jgi:hypothetical protein
LTDSDVRIETDEADFFKFFSTNPEVTEKLLRVNDTLTFIAKDGYTLGITLTSGKPDEIRALDELGASPFETLEFNYFKGEHHSNDELHLIYALTPARDLQDARQLASSVNEIAEAVNLQQITQQLPQQIPFYVAPLLAAVLIVTVSLVLIKHFNGRLRLVRSRSRRSSSSENK